MKQTNKKTWREKEGGKILQQQQLIIITNFPQIYRWIHDKYTPPASKKVSTECGAGFYGSEEKFKLFTDWSNVHYGSTSPFSPISTNHEQLTKLRRSHAPDTKNPQICLTPRRLSVRFDSVLLFLLKLLGPLIKLLQQFNNCKVQWAFSLRFLPFTTFNLFYKRTKWCERKKPHETASSWFPVLRFL